MKYTKSLKGNINFKRILKQGKYKSCKNISIYFKKNEEFKNENLLGICVSKKHGNSVIRNKLKRWAREAYFSLEDKMKKNYAIVILYRKGIDVEKISYCVVRDELTYLFTKNELLDE